MNVIDTGFGQGTLGKCNWVGFLIIKLKFDIYILAAKLCHRNFICCKLHQKFKDKVACHCNLNVCICMAWHSNLQVPQDIIECENGKMLEKCFEVLGACQFKNKYLRLKIPKPSEDK